jgi:SET domain-containing protein
MPASYLSPKTVVRKSPIEGRGLFARRRIRAGEIVAIKGGHILDRRALRRVRGRIAHAYVQIADGFFIGATTAAEVRRNKIFLNHSCAPNVGILGQIIFVALRDVRSGEELTYDWAMEENEPARTRCRCGAPGCRGTLSGRDWTRAALQRKYRRHFSAFLAEKIRRRARFSSPRT